MKPIIYKTVNLINHKIYVGSTLNPLNEKYLGSGILILRAIKKYGRENFKRVVIEECEIDNKQQRESFWIETLKSYDRTIGYNISRSGVGPDKPYTELRKERIKKSLTGLKRTPEQCNNISKGKIGKKLSPEHIKKISVAHKGHKWSDEQRKNISEKRKGKKILNPRKGIRLKHFKETREDFVVIQKDKNGNFVKEWENLLQIKLNTQWRISYIEDAIRGVRKSAYKFRWKKKT